MNNLKFGLKEKTCCQDGYHTTKTTVLSLFKISLVLIVICTTAIFVIKPTASNSFFTAESQSDVFVIQIDNSVLLINSALFEFDENTSNESLAEQESTVENPIDETLTKEEMTEEE